MEIPYGALFNGLKKRLDTAGGLWAILLVIAATWAVAALADRWDAWRARPRSTARPAPAT